MVERVADRHVQRVVGKEEGAVGNHEIAHVDEIRLVDRHLPQKTKELVVAGENAVVRQNRDHAHLLGTLLDAICFHTDDVLNWRSFTHVNPTAAELCIGEQRHILVCALG